MAKEKVLNTTVVRLGLVSLLADVAGDMLYPITPIFLTTVLGAGMASVGLVEGCAEAVASVLKLTSGAWSDRSGVRKPFVVTGYLIAALAKPLTGVSSSWTHVLFARSLDRTGKGLRTAPRDALLSESVAEDSRGAAFGWHRAMDTTGAALGPLIALLYLNLHPENLRPIYFWATVPALLAVLISLTVREKRGSPRKSSWPKWSECPPNFRRYLAIWAIFSLGNSSDVFLLMRAKSFGFSTSMVVLLYCAYNCFYALLSPYFGGMSDRLGRKKILSLGLVVFALVYTGFAFAQAQWHFWVLFGCYGIYNAATEGVGKAFAVDLVPKDRKATAIGTLAMLTGFASLFASFAAGLLWDQFGPAAPFLFGAAGALVSAALFLTRGLPSRDIAPAAVEV